MTLSDASTSLQLEPGKAVRAPAGNIVLVREIRVVGDHVEVKVEYPTGDLANFRAKHLRALP
jgi:hypothetical protein